MDNWTAAQRAVAVKKLVRLFTVLTNYMRSAQEEEEQYMILNNQYEIRGFHEEGGLFYSPEYDSAMDRAYSRASRHPLNCVPTFKYNYVTKAQFKYMNSHFRQDPIGNITLVTLFIYATRNCRKQEKFLIKFLKIVHPELFSSRGLPTVSLSALWEAFHNIHRPPAVVGQIDWATLIDNNNDINVPNYHLP